ncbi:MAG: ABC transporter substrate-binding protein [Clostridia bacterium]|nr:ABC transporter substrate-binding protein [Clostridia bacterium]
MKYTLDTIPVLDAYKTECECPLCKLRIHCEDQYIDSMLSSAYMEPDYRLKTNETGFCTRHFELMYNRRNRLGLALMTHTHMQEVIKSLEGILGGESGAKRGFLSSLRGGGKTAADSQPQKIRARMDGCFICDQMKNSIERYAYTIAQLYFTHTEFRGMFDNSKGFCLPHLALVLEMAEKTLNASQAEQFAKVVSRVELENLRRVEGELEWFTLKFDYRNDSKPWGNSRDAVERSINKLMGACVGAEAEMPAHND